MPLSSAAKVFLAKVLTIENSVTSEKSQNCIICQERCGSLSPETGVIEVEVRLPCNHTVGSAVSSPPLSSFMIHADVDTYSASQLGSGKAIRAQYAVANFSHVSHVLTWSME